MLDAFVPPVASASSYKSSTCYLTKWWHDIPQSMIGLTVSPTIQSIKACIYDMLLYSITIPNA
jgi:hypothetical protein